MHAYIRGREGDPITEQRIKLVVADIDSMGP